WPATRRQPAGRRRARSWRGAGPGRRARQRLRPPSLQTREVVVRAERRSAPRGESGILVVRAERRSAPRGESGILVVRAERRSAPRGESEELVVRAERRPRRLGGARIRGESEKPVV